MFIDFTEEQRRLRTQLRAYFRQLITPEVRAATRGAEGGDVYKRVIRQIGSDGWLALGWPGEYGGQGRSPLEQLIFLEEAQYARAPYPFVTVNTVGPALIAHGSAAHKARFLPGIARGEIHFAIGYTEPGAGTDLAALKTSAVRDGDDFVISGSKIFTSGAEAADYVWLAVRTDPDANRHTGISIIIVPTDTPGFSFTPIRTVGNVGTNVSYYDNVRVGADMLVGELHGGWRLITSQLNHERVGLGAWGINAVRLFEETLAWARAEQDGARPLDQPWVRQAMARAYAYLDARRLVNYRMAWAMDQGEPNPALASAAKVYGTECMIEVCRLLLEVLGTGALLQPGSPAALLAGDLEEEYRRCQINTFGGGINEIQRELVAQFGLRLPRTLR